MGKITEYKCDFCAQPAKADGVFGIYWLSDNKTIKIVPPHDAGHHLCHCCYNAFSKHFVDSYEHETKHKAYSYTVVTQPLPHGFGEVDD